MGGKTVVLGALRRVDSAVAARLLQEQGLHGLRALAGHRPGRPGGRPASGGDLRHPFSAGDIRRELEASVMGPFQRDYLAGRTPLPCARCNPTVKFPPCSGGRRRWGADCGHRALCADCRRTGGGAAALPGAPGHQ